MSEGQATAASLDLKSEMQAYAEVAHLIAGVDPSDPRAVDDFYENHLPTLPQEQQDRVLEMLLRETIEFRSTGKTGELTAAEIEHYRTSSADVPQILPLEGEEILNRPALDRMRADDDDRGTAPRSPLVEET